MKLEHEEINEAVVALDTYNSDLNLVIDASKYSAHPLTNEGFAFMWAGVRGTHGAAKGKFCFEAKILEHLDVSHLPEDEPNPTVVRVGVSVEDSTLQLGEDPQSYGYGGTGKISTKCQFKDFGGTFMAGDCILCAVNFDSDQVQIGYAKNGNFLGWAFRVNKSEIQGKALFPHILTKNCSFEVNFGERQQPYFPLPEVVKDYTFIGCLPMEQRVGGTRAPNTREECEMIMMCGLPGAGKSVWAAEYSAKHPEQKYNVLGTNNIIDKMKVMGLPRKRNYAGRWDVLIQMATKCLNKMFEIGSKLRRNYILDQTNVYPTAQRRKMRNFEGFKRVAVVVVPTEEEYKRRCDKRDREEGKEIPDQAVLEMKANFKLPEVNDIFNEVIFTELQREEAEKLVKKYNEEGKAAVGPAKKMFRPNESTGGNKGFDAGRGNFISNRGGSPSRGSYDGSRGGRGGRGGYDGARDEFGNRGGYGGRGNYMPGRGGFDGGRGNFGSGRGGFSGGRGSYDNGRGGYNGGRGSYDGGRGSYDGGKGSYDGGRSSYDGGRGSYDGGRGSYDGGRGGYESGRGGYDSGRGSYDSGRGSYDSGRGSYDSGRGSYDSGRGSYDSGRGSYDSGRGSYDSGRGGYDSGRGGYDFGNSNFDSGRGGGRGGYDGRRGGYDSSQGGRGAGTPRGGLDRKRSYDNGPGSSSTNYYSDSQSNYSYDSSSYDEKSSGYGSTTSNFGTRGGPRGRGSGSQSFPSRDYNYNSESNRDPQFSDTNSGKDPAFGTYDRNTSSGTRNQRGFRGGAFNDGSRGGNTRGNYGGRGSGSSNANLNSRGGYSSSYTSSYSSYGDFSDKSQSTYKGASENFSRDSSRSFGGTGGNFKKDTTETADGSNIDTNRPVRGTGRPSGRTGTRWSAEIPQGGTATATDSNYTSYGSNVKTEPPPTTARPQYETYTGFTQTSSSTQGTGYQTSQTYGYQTGLASTAAPPPWPGTQTAVTANQTATTGTDQAAQWPQYYQQSQPNQYFSQYYGQPAAGAPAAYTSVYGTK